MNGSVGTIAGMGIIFWLAMAMAGAVVFALIGGIILLVVLARVVARTIQSTHQAASTTTSKRHRFDVYAAFALATVAAFTAFNTESVRRQANIDYGLLKNGNGWLDILFVGSVMFGLLMLSMYLLQSGKAAVRLPAYLLLPLSFFVLSYLVLVPASDQGWVLDTNSGRYVNTQLKIY